MEEEDECLIPDSSLSSLSSESCSIPRGGPIYFPNMVGPSTTLNHVQSYHLQNLLDLQSLLCEDPSSPRSSNHDDDDDLEVNELKVFTDDELMDMALKQVSLGGDNNNNNKNHPPFPQQSNDKSKSHKNSPKKKRKGRRSSNSSLQSGCLEKVDQVVKIKHSQEEDKATVRLNSFNPICKITKCPVKYTNAVRMRSLGSTSSTSSTGKVNPVGLHENRPVMHQEVVLCVEVYHNVRKSLKTQELLVLGGQTLTALRDKINCSIDQVMQKAGQNDPSGYFLIEDVFYNDLRDPSATDYSRPILDWIQNSKEEAQEKWEYIMNGEMQQKQKAIMGEVSAPPPLPHFTSVEMHKIHFCDLRFRLGAAYLYCHQGDCNHVIVIRDMRLLHSHDVQNQAAYPIISFQAKLRFQKCNVCKIFRATKVTVDDKFAPENPCLFCDECFALLHLDEDGSPLYTEFTEYDCNHD